MKKSLLVLSLISLYGSAFAADFTDTARVISSTPIYERVTEPKRECWTETVQVAPKERSMGGAVVGGGSLRPRHVIAVGLVDRQRIGQFQDSLLDALQAHEGCEAGAHRVRSGN